MDDSILPSFDDTGEWTMNDICTFLSIIDMNEYVEKIVASGVHMYYLVSVTDKDDFINIGIDKLGPRMRLLRSLDIAFKRNKLSQRRYLRAKGPLVWNNFDCMLWNRLSSK